MTIRTTCRYLLFALFALMLQPCAGWAAKSFAVAPFSINGPNDYQYLSKGIQDMMVSRLHWAGNFETLDKEKVDAATGGKAIDDGKAAATRSQLGADYLVYGSVTILGKQSSVDVKVIGPDGKVVPHTAQSELDRLIPTLEVVATKINKDIFDRPTDSSNKANDVERVNAMNPGLIHNETSQNQEFYLNPQFRYAGDAQSEGRLRSPTLPYSGTSIVVGDADNDGRNECFISSEDTIYAYRFDVNNNMEPIGEYSLGPRLTIIRMSLVDLNRNGMQDLVVSAIFLPVEMDVQKVVNTADINTPRGYVFSLEGNKLVPKEQDIDLFLATAPTPPNFTPMLVGQRRGPYDTFDTTVHEIVKMSGKYTLGGRLLLPPKGNAFNFVYLPQGDADYKIILTNKKDRLEVYNRSGGLEFTTDNIYSGSSLGVVDPRDKFHMKDDLIMNAPYYIPLRMLPVDLNGDGSYELIVNHPISVAAMFFDRYRNFPQGEIHCLYWDGVGMTLVWKTRRIKGSVADYGVADINNDGIKDLYVLVNTHPGMVGMGRKRTAVLIYPLDTSKTDSTTPVNSEFTEEQ